MSTKSPDFGKIAELYDRYRPGYPTEVHDVVLRDLDISNLRALEIGCGTGKATTLFRDDQTITLDAIDPAEESLAVARANLPYSHVTFLCSTFENFQFANSSYDLIFSAHAFHWTDPTTRYQILDRALSKTGRFSMFRNTTCGDAEVYALTHGVWCRYFRPGDPPPTHFDPKLGELYEKTRDKFRDELLQSAMFSQVEVHEIPNNLSYTTESYIGYLSTESDAFKLSAEEKAAYLSDVADVIDSKLGGEVMIPTNTVVYVSDR